MLIHIIIDEILDPIFFTIGVLFLRVITIGRFPGEKIKEKYKLLFVVLGLIVSVVVLYLVYTFFFKS